MAPTGASDNELQVKESMFISAAVRRSLPISLPLLAVALLTFTAGTAHADPFGELSKFGSKGTGNGQFIQNFATTAFGVDPTDNSVYVGDEPEAKKFRIQKFSASGVFLGKAEFFVKGSAEEPESGIEGIAVDPVDNRIYVLALQLRGTEEHVIVDPEIEAAGSLYAFSTVPNGAKELEPAAGTEAGKEGRLAGPSVFHPQSSKLGANSALLTPSGIAVDPKTHDVIVMGREDLTPAEPALRVSLERISSKGEFVDRYTDHAAASFFGEEESIADSPIVSPAGKVYVLGGAIETGGAVTEQIDEIPASFSSSEAPTPLIRFNSGPQELVTFPGEPAPLRGAAMSLSPEGTIDVYAKVHGEAEGKGFIEPGAVQFDLSSGAEMGWTGGQTAASGLGKCTISFLGHPMVAAGKEGMLFVFDSNPAAPAVVVFGAGGNGCPAAKSSALAFTRGGKPVEGTVPPGEEVKLSSTLTRGNALSVKWHFGDGTADTETKGQFLAPETTHKFTTEGEFKLTETIHTDNLATPEVVEERTLVVEKARPTARFKYAGEVKVGEADRFDGTPSTASTEAAKITRYGWEFGDGAKGEGPVVEHSYASAGSYTVKLVVTDSLGLTSKVAEHTVTVSNPPPPPPTTTTTTGAAGSSSAQPKSGVLAYSASFAGTSVTVTSSGVMVVKVTCGGPSSCSGTVTLRTLTAVSARKKKAILVLASGTLSLSGGQTRSLMLRLSAKGKALLLRSHLLRAKATFAAHDQQGKPQTTETTLTLRLQKGKHH